MTSEGEAAASPRGTRILLGVASARVWLLLAGVYVVALAAGKLFAPCGYWMNVVRGVEFWDSCDPESAYLGSAIHFFGPEDGPPFQGHPGLPLQLLLHGIARVAYSAQALWGEPAFFTFAARNFCLLSVLAGLSALAIHLAGFLVLARVAHRLLGDRLAASASVLIYATSFPVLYFATRGSPEPMMVLFFLLTLERCWISLERFGEGALNEGFSAAALAGVFALLGVLTKVHLLGALPVFALLLLLTGASAQGSRAALGARLKATGAFLAGALGTALAGSLFLNLDRFWLYWKGYVPGAVPAGTRAGDVNVDWLAGVSAVIGRVVPFVRAYTGFGRNMLERQGGLFALAELAFMFFAMAGFWLVWRQGGGQRVRATWLVGYLGLVTPIAVVRMQFHYLFLHVLVGSIFCGAGLVAVLKRVPATIVGEERRPGAVLLAAVLLHVGAIGMLAGAKVQDVSSYRALAGPIQTALAKVERGRRVGLVSEAPFQSPLFVSNGLYPKIIPPTLPLWREYEANFIPVIVKPGEEPTAAFCDANGIDVLVDLRRDSRVERAPHTAGR